MHFKTKGKWRILNKRSKPFGVAICLLICMLLFGCNSSKTISSNNLEQNPGGTESQGPKEVKVGFVYSSAADDGGWASAQDRGRKYLEANLPGISTTIIENVQPGADAERVMTQLAEQGYQVIVATEFGFMDNILKVAKNYPKTVFLHCSGYVRADNVGTYFWKAYQGRYLTGMLAGKLTKTNIIGYSASHPIPLVIRGINAFTLGVRAVNPDAKVKVVWTNTWYDPAVEKQAAESLMDAGADIISTHLDSPAGVQAAAARGNFAIGYDSDMSKFAPDHVITSIEADWGPYFVEEIKRVQEGTWESRDYWGGMIEGLVNITPYGPMVTDEMKQMVEDKKQQIISGQWDVFTGPIKDQKGQLIAKDGERIPDSDLLGTNYFVEGVDGTIPQ
jgi:basic membrane protein A